MSDIYDNLKGKIQKLWQENELLEENIKITARALSTRKPLETLKMMTIPFRRARKN